MVDLLVFGGNNLLNSLIFLEACLDCEVEGIFCIVCQYYLLNCTSLRLHTPYGLLFLCNDLSSLINLMGELFDDVLFFKQSSPNVLIFNTIFFI